MSSLRIGTAVQIAPLYTIAVERIYAAALKPEGWPTALQAAADMLGDVGAILIFSRDDGTYGVIETLSLGHCVLEYRDHWSDRDIRAIRSSERGYFFKRDIITDADVVTDDEIASDPFYVDFLARYGLKYFAALMVSPSARVEVAVSIQRSLDRSRFSEEELAQLRKLGPHIENSLRISMRLMDAELVNLELGDALSRIGIGVFALDALGRVTFSNGAGRGLLGDGLDIVNEKLRISGVSADYIDSAGMGDGAVYANTTPIVIRQSQSRRSLAVYILPVRALGSATQLMLTDMRVLVLVVDLEPGKPPEPSLVRDILGVTLGEARVASLVGAGLGPKEAAQKLAISEETARTVLKRVYSKIGISRQSELAALLARLSLR